MHRDLIDDVPVLWADAPGPLTAALIFGCGARDETFRTLGVTHLVEHLAMSTLPRLHHEHNAQVDLELTQFTATGRPDQVVAFLDRVCRALADLPVDRADRESGVLAAEDGCAAHPTAGALLTHRYGIQGLGLAPFSGPGPDRIPLDAVRDCAARYFHAGNAVLTLTGPPPPGLRLPLPAGDRPDRSGTQPVLVTASSWQEDTVPGPGLGVHGDLADQGLQLAMAVLQERLREVARNQRGLSYDVSCDRALAGPDGGDRMIHLDARDGEEQQVAELLWQQAVLLAAEGPSAEEVAEEAEGTREFFLDPRTVALELEFAANAELLGWSYRSVADRLDLLDEVTPEQVREAFARAMDSALLVVPIGTRPGARRADGTELPEGGCAGTAGLPAGGRTFRAPLRDRLTDAGARRARLVVTGEGLWTRMPSGGVHHIAFADVVGVEVHTPGRVVFGRNHCVIPVMPELFAGIGPALTAVDEAVPAELHYPASAFKNAD
ncbi:insulinase family protein [Kitasatospora sp. NPDC048540]|uniref:insulinase family protein n=1 Tax=unclassified Kitasatospora TaxID=2633591 RepID=UPI00068E7507|nr:insulinase family protein [Kitasatospora sp. MBT63]